MSVIFQDPNASGSRLLIEELAEHFKSADSIYCAFAFVTERGLNLLFEQDDIKKNLRRVKVELVVGVDAITDIKALNRLSVLCSTYPRFSAQVFIPSASGIFHPKVSWVRTGNAGVVIVGSGNLTPGGLKNNFEAFSIVAVDEVAIDALESTWNQFLADNSGNLFALDSDEAVKAAEQNGKINKAIKRVRKAERKNRIGGDVIPDATSAVFIQELTKGRGGKQRDVGLWPAEHFFGENKQLYLTHIDSHGKRETEEIRAISRKRSANAAIDLNASKGLQPVGGQMPISVFIRTSPNNFFYHIVDTNSPNYNVVSSYLTSEAGTVRAGHAKRVPNENRPAPISVKKLRDVWPQAPFWKLEADEDSDAE